MPYRREDLEALKRPELVKICKEQGVKCTGKNSELIAKLLFLCEENKMGIECETDIVVEEQPEEGIVKQEKKEQSVTHELLAEEQQAKEETKEHQQQITDEAIVQVTEEAKENGKKVCQGTKKKTKLELEKEEARLKLERRLKYNAKAAVSKPLPYKPYSGPLINNNK